MKDKTKGVWRVLEINISDYQQLCISSDSRPTVLCHVYLPENKIDEEARANAKLMSSSPLLYEALVNLVQLKKWKDKYGKDEYYQKSRQEVWNNAISLIESIDDGWMSLDTQESMLRLPKDRDFMCRFDDGSENLYSSKHPFALLTHWREL